MSDYTPSLATAREVFIEGAQGEFLGEDFDRMIEAVRAEEREKAAQIAEDVAHHIIMGEPRAAERWSTERAVIIAARIRNQEAGE